MWEKYGKTIIAFLFTVYTVVQPLWSGDHHIDPDEGIIIAAAVGNNLLVYIIPVFPGFRSAKTVITAVLGALVVAQTVIADGFQAEDWPMIIGAFIAGIGVFIAPATSKVNGQVVKVETGSDG